MNDEAIQKIMNYTNMHLFEPGENWPKSAIMERSYERWAVDEILLAIMDHPMTEADLVIEGFILKMELFLYLSENPANNHIFYFQKEKHYEGIKKAENRNSKHSGRRSDGHSAGRAWRVYRDRSQGYGRGRHVYI